MKIGTVAHQGKSKPVVLLNDETAVDLSADFADVAAIVKAGEAGLRTVRDRLASPAATIRLAEAAPQCPILPEQYRDCMVFEAHLQNALDQSAKASGQPARSIPQVWYEQPIYYKGNRFSFIGPEAEIEWPSYCDFLDIELEMAIVVGKTGKNITVEDAPSYIWGYTILNDVSARDAQMREMAGQLGPAKGKDFDTGNILGPWIVTADEIPYPPKLDMEAKVNGERWGGGNSSQMHHSFADILAHISKSETIHAGEVIGSGTVGTGCGLEIGKRLSPGDRIELTIEKIGTLRNTVGAEC